MHTQLCTPRHAHLVLLGAHPAVHTQLYGVHTQLCTPLCTPHTYPLLRWAHAEPQCCTHHGVPHPSSHPVFSPATGSQRRGQPPSKVTAAAGAGVPAPQSMPMHSCLSERGGLSILMEQRLGAPGRRMSTPASRVGAGGAGGHRREVNNAAKHVSATPLLHRL